MKRRLFALTLALLLVSGGLWLYSLLSRNAGGWAVAEIDGRPAARISLQEDTTLVLGEDGHTNTIVVKDGGVSVVSASCPDKVCVKQGEIRYEGQVIVCLPNRLIISIEGPQAPETDAQSK